ncbi:MAG: hypothetical protein WKF41_16105 [Gaiellaceae bacterium]
MKKLAFVLFLFAVIVPAALAAPPAQSPAAYCNANAGLIGTGKLYRNFGACISKQQAQQDANTANAAKLCKAELADPNFAAGHGGKSFAQYYATTSANVKGNGNAFGKCVAQKASTKTAAQQTVEVKAAKTCRTDAMKAATGEGKLYRNFGACVAAHSKKG